MKTDLLRDAFEQGITAGKSEQQTEPTLRNIWALVAPKFGYPFKAEMNDTHLQVTYGEVRDPMGVFNIPSLQIQDLGDGTFNITSKGVGAHHPQPAETVLKSLGRFYGLHNRG